MKSLAVLILLCLASPVLSDTTGIEIPVGVMVVDGRPAPPLALPDIDGQHTDLATKRGRWVLVHFWASWCGPCRKEMPTFQGLIEQISDAPIDIVLVNTAETDDEVFNFLTFIAPDLSTLMDYDGLATELWQPRGLPASYLVDPGGRIRYLALGGRLWDSPEYVNFILELTEK